MRWLPFFAAATVSCESASIRAHTSCGALDGVVTSAAGSPVASFLGLSYGVVPGRWRAPLPAPCWSGVLNASAYGPICVQASGAGSEDCLSLNVFSPLAPSGVLPSALPVMVYIHGGSLVEGSGAFERTAAFSVKTSCVSVTLNYRLTFEGWLLSAGMLSEGSTANFGVLDLQLALGWVQREIKNLGGDPTRVTLAGQSSGGTAIFALLSSPASAGLFSGAIALSGSPNITQDLPSKLAQDAAFVVAVGCGGLQPGMEMACLRGANLSTLVAKQLTSWFTPGIFATEALRPSGFAGVYGGLVFVDGAVVTAPFEDAFAAPTVDVPVIMGNMAQENDFNSGMSNLTLPQWREWLVQHIGAKWGANSTPFSDALYARYLADALLDVQRAYSSIHADYSCSCAFSAVAARAKRAGRRRSPVYVHYNQWQPSAGGRRWAYHTWDYACAFENFPITPGPTELAHAAFLQSAWGSLLHTGRVNASASWGWGSVEEVPGWPDHVGIMRISNETLAPFQGPAFVPDLRGDACTTLANFGVGSSNFWWVN
jgi:carboxylesterase type B